MARENTTVTNPIVRGYRWAQQFLCPAGTLEPLDEIESELYWVVDKRPPARWATAKTSSGEITVDDQTIQINIPAEVTARLVGGRYGALDFKRVRDGEETYLGVVATFPIREPYTKGEQP